MSPSRRQSLAVLASHPIQYFTPIYRRLAQVPGLEVDVFYCRDFGVRNQFDKQFGRAIQWDVDQLSGYRHRFLTNVSPVTSTFNPLHAINPGAFTRMLRGYGALMVNGYVYPSNWLAAAAGWFRGTKLLLHSDMRLDPHRRPKRTDALRNRLLGAWVRRSDALLYVGRANREAYLAYGARDEQLFFSPFSVDVETMVAARANAAARSAERARWGAGPETTVLLFVGKLVEQKHPELMLDIAASVAGDDALVVVAGSGPLEPTLRDSARARALGNVRFLGFVNQSALPTTYAAADVFVMPSEREAWGLALNEAMAAGLAPVTWDEVGATADLIEDGVTGSLIEGRSAPATIDAVRRLVASPPLRIAMGKAAQARASLYSYDASVAGIVQALRTCGVYGG